MMSHISMLSPQSSDGRELLVARSVNTVEVAVILMQENMHKYHSDKKGFIQFIL